jgi:hypothetical protein
MVVEVTHVAYSDETHHNVGRFKGIGVVTSTVDNATRASEEVKAILATANVSELKWEKLRTARDRIAAIQVADWLFSRINVLRVDVLTWDIEDPRHRLRGRDDVANLHRMPSFEPRAIRSRCSCNVVSDLVGQECVGSSRSRHG